MKTVYDRWLEVNQENDLEVLKFFFKNSVLFMNKPVRKFRMGVKVKTTFKDTYYEYDKFTNIILSYPLENGNIGQCNGEIVLDEFIESIKRADELIKM